MQIIIGLGNPGSKYSDTWHNLGFIAADRLSQKYGLSFKAGKGKFYSASGFINSVKTVIVKPTTYMNLSGIAAAEVLRYYEAGTADLLVVYDDINIDLGTIRIRRSGSAGGHNGIKSLIGSLETDEFARIRIGFKTEQIGSILAAKPEILPDLVLSKIPSSAREIISCSVDRCVEAVEYLLEHGIDKAMNRFNSAGSDQD